MNFFGFRARDESRRLKWGDVKLCKDEANSSEFLVWQSERGSKTRTGNGQRAFSALAEASNRERCPVIFYKDFMKHRLSEMKTPKPHFFLQLTTKEKQTIQYGIDELPWAKMRLANFSRKQLQMQVSKVTSLTTASEKPAFPS